MTFRAKKNKSGGFPIAGYANKAGNISKEFRNYWKKAAVADLKKNGNGLAAAGLNMNEFKRAVDAADRHLEMVPFTDDAAERFALKADEIVKKGEKLSEHHFSMMRLTYDDMLRAETALKEFMNHKEFVYSEYILTGYKKAAENMFGWEKPSESPQPPSAKKNQPTLKL